MEEPRANFDFIKGYLEKTTYFPQHIYTNLVLKFSIIIYIKYKLGDLVGSVDSVQSRGLGFKPSTFWRSFAMAYIMYTSLLC